MSEKTYHGKVVGKKSGIYTVYVFQLDDNSYEMCTLLPNWGLDYQLEVGDSGFVTSKEVHAGEPYFDRITGEQKMYQFDKTYLQEFIKDKVTKKIILT